MSDEQLSFCLRAVIHMENEKFCDYERQYGENRKVFRPVSQMLDKMKKAKYRRDVEWIQQVRFLFAMEISCNTKPA